MIKGWRGRGRKLTKPVVNPKVRQEIPNKYIPSTVGLSEIDEGRDGDSDTEIGEQDKLAVLSLVQWRGWVEVVDACEPSVLLSSSAALLLELVVVVSSNVRDKVKNPSSKLLTDQMDESSDWCLLSKLIELVKIGRASCRERVF